MTNVTKWGPLQRGDLKALTEHERDYARSWIPAGSPVLYWTRVSWWQHPLTARPPLLEEWPLGDPGQVAYFCLAAGSDAEAGWREWCQPARRYY